MAGTTVSPSIPSGVARRKGAILGGLAFLTVAYGVVYFVLRDSGSFLRPADEFCPDSEPGCSRPDLFAFQVSSQIMQLFMGISGFMAWHVSKRAHSAIPATPEGRLFGYIEEADRLNAGIFVFQVWDFFASLSIPEHATPVFLTHHLLAALCAYLALEYQYAHHYAIFFGGCSEISSIFLVIVDFDNFFPASHGTSWGGLVTACQGLFVLTFFYYRIVGWWQESYRLWSDAFIVLGKKSGLRPGKSLFFLYIFLAVDVLLGLLQVYWFSFGILPKLVEIFGGS